MDLARITQLEPWCWTISHSAEDKRAEVKLYGNAQLLETMNNKVFVQIANVARLPGLVGCAITMPDAHWRYGFPIEARLHSIRNGATFKPWRRARDEPPPGVAAVAGPATH